MAIQGARIEDSFSTVGALLHYYIIVSLNFAYFYFAFVLFLVLLAAVRSEALQMHPGSSTADAVNPCTWRRNSSLHVRLKA